MAAENPGAIDKNDHGLPSEVAIVQIAVDDLEPHPMNAAVYGDEPVDDELVASVKTHDVVAPLHCTAEHIVVDGHRRLKAARAAALATVPVIILDARHDDLVIEEMLLESNRTRNKNNEQKVREFMAYERIENERARARMLRGMGPTSKSTEGSVNKIAGEARVLAARKVGMSWGKAKHGAAVVLVIDRLHAEGDLDAVENLRETLNKKTVETAHNEAIKRGWIKGTIRTLIQKHAAENKQDVTPKSGEDQTGDDTPADATGSSAEASARVPQAPAVSVIPAVANPNPGSEAPEAATTIYRDQPLPEQEAGSTQNSSVNSLIEAPALLTTTVVMASPSAPPEPLAQHSHPGTVFHLANGGEVIANIAEEGVAIPARKVRVASQLNSSLADQKKAGTEGTSIRQYCTVLAAESLNRLGKILSRDSSPTTSGGSPPRAPWPPTGDEHPERLKAAVEHSVLSRSAVTGRFQHCLARNYCTYHKSQFDQ